MNRHPLRNKILVCAAIILGMLASPACNINVKKTPSGEDKKVDIETPFGSIHVDKDVDVRDTGLAVYPDARPVEKGENGNEKSANVNISAGVFGLKVVAVEYQSGDAPEKIIAYYKDQLKKYGPVLECHTTYHSGGSASYKPRSDSDKDSHQLTCDSNGGNDVELKVGTKENQHIVAVHAQDKGSRFALVLVQVHGKETI